MLFSKMFCRRIGFLGLSGVMAFTGAVGMTSVSAGAAAFVPVLTETYDSDPIAGARAVVQSDDLLAGDRFTYNAGSGTLTAAYDSSRQSAKLSFPLGRTLTQSDTFKFTMDLVIQSAGYFRDNTGGLAQIAFGLLNQSTTGVSRTGDPAVVESDTYDVVSVDYFPMTNPFFDSMTITPTVFESQKLGSNDAFDGISAPFFEESVINNAGEVGELLLDTAYRFEMLFDSPTRTMTVTLTGPGGLQNINQVGAGKVTGGPDGDVLTIQHTIPGGAAFEVDAFGLMLWEDGFNQIYSFVGADSLRANVDFDAFEVSVLAVPEPTGLGLLLAMGLLLRRRRGV